MNEQEGRAVLKRCFEAEGFAIVDDYPLVDGDLVLSVDGFDPARRVGYEYITTEAGDREEITPRVLAEIEKRIESGVLHLLLIDEQDIPGAAELERAAAGFCAFLRQRGVG